MGEIFAWNQNDYGHHFVSINKSKSFATFGHAPNLIRSLLNAKHKVNKYADVAKILL